MDFDLKIVTKIQYRFICHLQLILMVIDERMELKNQQNTILYLPLT